MTNIVVLGSDGLLGSHICALHDVIPVSKQDCDITDTYQLEELFEKYRPDVVINCAGVTPRNQQTELYTYRVNAYGPKLLAHWADRYSTRVIQVSTDCVFDGKRGSYSERDFPNAESVYGMSKLFGEITEYPHLTIRTSFIGWPDIKGRGLAAWLHREAAGISQPLFKKHIVPGYKNYLWNGLTTVALGDILYKLAFTNLGGLLHIYGETLSKYDLLKILAEVYCLDVDIVPVEQPVVDMTLISKYISSTVIPIRTLIEDMAEKEHIITEKINEFTTHNDSNDNILSQPTA